jgi:hypothetical protein
LGADAAWVPGNMFVLCDQADTAIGSTWPRTIRELRGRRRSLASACNAVTVAGMSNGNKTSTSIIVKVAIVTSIVNSSFP